MNALYNFAHIVGGMAAAFIVMEICRKRLANWVTMCLMVLAALAVNGLWELMIDTWGWFSFIEAAAEPDIGDIIRGALGGAVIAVWYFIVQVIKYRRLK